MADYASLDDAAAAFSWMLPRLFADAPQQEYMSALLPDGSYSPPQTSGQKGKVKVQLPATLTGLVHNHPELGARRDLRSVGGAEQFSDGDRQTMRQLGVPSYIATPSGRLKRLTPGNGAKPREVLAQFPVDEFRDYLMQRLLERAPDDSRGLMR
jgi:hypothetical protein